MALAEYPPQYLISKVITGIPEGLSHFTSSNGYENVSYALLQTGLKEYEVYFISTDFNNKKKYLITVLDKYRNSPLWTIKNLEIIDSSKIPQNTIDILFNNECMMISIKLGYKPTSNELIYTWVNKYSESKIAEIKKIDKPIELNKRMPDFTVETVTGDTISISDLKEKYVVINWWWLNCGACKAEIAQLNELVEKFKDNSNVVFIAIVNDTKTDLNEFLSQRAFKFIQTVSNPECLKLFGNNFPNYYIVNPKGVVCYFQSGGGSEKAASDIEKALMQELNKRN